MPEADKLLKVLKENENFQQKIITQQMIEAKQKADLYVLRAENNELKDKLATKKIEEDALHVKLSKTDKEYIMSKTAHESEIVALNNKIKALESKNQLAVKDSKEAYTKLISSNGEVISIKNKLDESIKERKELDIRVCRLELEKRTNDNVHKTSAKRHKEIEDKNKKLFNENVELQKKIQEMSEKIKEFERIHSEHATEKTYEEYIELQSKYESALSALDNCNLTNEKLQRRLNDQEILQKKYSHDLQEYKEKSRALQKTIKKQETNYYELEFNLNRVLSDRRSLAQEKEKVEATLKDTTHQLQHILVGMEKHQISIPSSVSIFSEATTVSDTNNVFSSVAELQELNANLLTQLRTLKEEATATKDASDRFINEAHAKTLDEATDIITKLEALVIEKERRLEEAQKRLEEYGSKDDQEKSVEQSNQAVQESLKKLKETADMLTICRSEMTEQVQKLKDELYESHVAENKAKSDLTSYRIELAQLKQKNLFLTDSLVKKEEELSISKNGATLASNQLEQKESMIGQIQEKLLFYKEEAKKLEDDKKSLQGQVRIQSESYELVKKELSSIDSEKLHLSELLGKMNVHVEGLRNMARENAESAKKQNRQLTEEIQTCHTTISGLEKELEQLKYIGSEEGKRETKLLKEKVTELEQNLSAINKEKIVIETKLSEAESISKTTAGNEDDKKTNEEHINTIAELKDQVRILEDEKKHSMSTIEELKSRISDLSEKHKKSSEEAYQKIEELSADIEQRIQTTSEAQKFIQKTQEEYESLADLLQKSQTKIAMENQALKFQKIALEDKVAETSQQIEALVATLEVQKTMVKGLETDLNAEKQTHEQTKGLVSKSQNDLNTLQSELNDTKQILEDVKAQLQSKLGEYQTEASMWSEIHAKLNKDSEEADKKRHVIDTHIEELFGKLSKWEESDQALTDPEIRRLSQEAYLRLVNTNETLLLEKKAVSVNYFEECRKYKLLERETECIRQQLYVFRKKADDFEKQYNDSFKEKSAKVEEYRLEVDAFKKQNLRLMSTNKKLETDFQQTSADLQESSKELSMLSLKVKAFESQLKKSEEKIQAFAEKEKEWIAKSAQYDSKEIEAVKAELESAKAELQSLRLSAVPLNEKIKSLETELESTRSNQTAIVNNASQKQRIALELKNRLTEANKKNAELESTISELQKHTKDTPDKPVNNTPVSDNEQIKKLEESLKTKNSEYTTLETKYRNLLNKARAIQADKKRAMDELKTLKGGEAGLDASKNVTTDSSKVPILESKIVELEAKIEQMTKSAAEVDIELSRAKVMNSMEKNKNKRLQSQIDALKNEMSNNQATENTASQTVQKHVGVATNKPIREASVQDSAQNAEKVQSQDTDFVMSEPDDQNGDHTMSEASGYIAEEANGQPEVNMGISAEVDTSLVTDSDANANSSTEAVTNLIVEPEQLSSKAEDPVQQKDASTDASVDSNVKKTTGKLVEQNKEQSNEKAEEAETKEQTEEPSLEKSIAQFNEPIPNEGNKENQGGLNEETHENITEQLKESSSENHIDQSDEQFIIQPGESVENPESTQNSLVELESGEILEQSEKQPEEHSHQEIEEKLKSSLVEQTTKHIDEQPGQGLDEQLTEKLVDQTAEQSDQGLDEQLTEKLVDQTAEQSDQGLGEQLSEKPIELPNDISTEQQSIEKMSDQTVDDLEADIAIESGTNAAHELVSEDPMHQENEPDQIKEKADEDDTNLDELIETGVKKKREDEDEVQSPGKRQKSV